MNFEPPLIQNKSCKSAVCLLFCLQVKSSASDSVMTFAHEVGHNMGAEHDEDAGCPSGFIMSESGSTKRSHMDQEFSNCSITAIHKHIKSVKNHR